jgi:hypothetical protein
MSNRTVHYHVRISDDLDCTLKDLSVKLGKTRGEVLQMAIRLLEIAADADGVSIEKDGEATRVKVR